MQTLAAYNAADKGGPSVKLMADEGLAKWPESFLTTRSDIDEGLRLGEEVAIRVLREERLTTHEPFGGFRFHRMDGREVRA